MAEALVATGWALLMLALMSGAVYGNALVCWLSAAGAFVACILALIIDRKEG